MAPKKGLSNNPNGRPPGVPNKITRALRPLLKEVITNELENLPNLLKSLEAKDRVSAIIKIMEFLLPKADGMLEMEELKPDNQQSDYMKIILGQCMKVEEDIKWRVEQEQAQLNQSKSLPPSNLQG